MTPSPAPLGRRLLAVAVDLAFVLAIVGVSLLRERATPFDGLFTFLGFGIAGVSWLVRDTGGASPGKRLSGLRVSRADGTRVGTATSARRNAGLGAALILSGAGTVLIADPMAEAFAGLLTVTGGALAVGTVVDAGLALFRPDVRRLGDRWAKTQVVRTGLV